MAETLAERVWTWLHETFPERQLYIRSDGRVQFFTLSSVFQGTVAGLTLIFLGWVAFATVNVIFKDRIIAAKDHRQQQQQAAYEARIADLQLAYDEVNTALVTADDRFKSAADELAAKQNAILQVLDHKRQVDAVVNRQNTVSASANADSAGPIEEGLDVGAPPSAIQSAPRAGQAVAPASGSSDITVDPKPVKPQPRGAKPTHASLLDFGGAVGRITGLFHRQRPNDIAPEVIARHPVLRQLAAQTERVKRLSVGQTVLMARTQGEAEQGVRDIRGVLKQTGINPDQFAQRVASAQGGVGGPEIPLSSVQLEGISDQAFQDAYLKASAVLEEMSELLAGMKHVPLTTPVSGPSFERTSGFGARVDPFTGRYAFHPGVDFAGPTGSTVHATAPGTVVWADVRGGYGKMVEINHGYGIHTRYAHLSSILVHVGARVGEGAPVGKLGSTGRSTGPHVHYEIWYDDVVRNPRNFIEAGRHVL
ncbi:murein DD-endopeptidase MepM/ murein hydrolase activator NlpD [Rhizomicrobium palustre]|uniref:Murein DD-endopeptidase MepM/ murein hydrolase activator NlpD n=1 Tax=Rhizomicrobium palustre TaxID=189966 RepID=A0A846N0J8_9PROT|nr:peptidoglycan DD-metalloendopeptidase family protein [Rhizomicrobium palustre]NIK89418.1 murein DD-endopeptidase MepM/ murein hydrolase activator NlpD [Rhizomicrobium palustre]